MTARYDLLINAILTTNGMILNLFLFAAGAVLAWHSLNWTPAWMQRPARYVYVAALIGILLSTVILSGS